MSTTTKDRDLRQLSGAQLDSVDLAGVSYLLADMIGEGAHGVVFSALRRHASVDTRVVVKVLRPRSVRGLGELAAPAIAKEVAALRRLSERAEPTPNVVQFLDSGTLRIGESPLALPWIALEHVDGGDEGVTLRARVEHALQTTGYAFDLARARRAVHDLCSGVRAIHEVHVIHRDLSPNNVLACGSISAECLKITDFGVARVSSVSTFGDVLLGTPGYCAPEQSFPEKVGVGTYTDVFGLACTVYFLLTGEHYFSARSIPETLMAVHAPSRRTLLGAGKLHPTLRQNRGTGAELDRIFALATREAPGERPGTIAELHAMLNAALAPL